MSPLEGSATERRGMAGPSGSCSVASAERPQRRTRTPRAARAALLLAAAAAVAVVPAAGLPMELQSAHERALGSPLPADASVAERSDAWTSYEGDVVPVDVFSCPAFAVSGHRHHPYFPFAHHPASSLSSALGPLTSSLFHVTRKCRCKVPPNSTLPGLPGNDTQPGEVPGDWEDVVGYWGVITTIVLLVAIGGIVSGLTLGYLSIDETTLAILIRTEPSVPPPTTPPRSRSPTAPIRRDSARTDSEREPLIPKPANGKPGSVSSGKEAAAPSLSKETVARDAELMRQKGWAQRIAPLRKDTHLLLVTLLLANTVVNETLPILFHTIDMDGWQAVLASTVLVVLFGEILPQAVCARHGLAVGAFFAGPVSWVQVLLWPVAKPVAATLDWVLGRGDGEGRRYGRQELKELVAMHGPPGPAAAAAAAAAEHAGSPGPGADKAEPPLTAEEVRLVRGVFDMRDKTVGEILTPLEDVFGIELGEVLGRARLEEILSTGHSRIPVHHGAPWNIVGAILVKSLAVLNPDAAVPVRDLPIRRLPVVDRRMGMARLLRVFESGGSHMAVVVERNLVPAPGEPEHATLGIVTLEDLIEELLGEEIVDETDVFVDVHARTPVTSRTAAFASLHARSLRPPSVAGSSTAPRRRRKKRVRFPAAAADAPGDGKDPLLVSKDELERWMSGAADTPDAPDSAGPASTLSFDGLPPMVEEPSTLEVPKE